LASNLELTYIVQADLNFYFITQRKKMKSAQYLTQFKNFQELKMRNLALTILMNILILTMLSAQNGQFAAGAFLHGIDCESGKVYVDLKIKAKDNDTQFYLADQNYRLSFNRSALQPGSVSIERELDISGIIQTSDDFSLYAEHTLGGSGDTIISYNVEFLSGSGYLVTADEWASVGRIGLDITNANECFTIEFHSQEIFPPTYVSEILDETTYVEIGGAYENLNVCLSDYCDGGEVEQLPVSVEEFADNQSNIQVLPTAVHNELTVHYTLEQHTGMTQITIADMQGRIWQQSQKQLTGQDVFKFDVSDLPQGIYLVNTLIDGGWIPRKFVKI